MDTTILIYLGVAFLLGIMVAWMFGRSKATQYARTSDDKALTKNRVRREDKAEEYQETLEKASQKIQSEYEVLLENVRAKLGATKKRMKQSLEIGDTISSGETGKIIEGLKKKIKSLEDDLADAEDDLEVAKKKLRNKENVLSELQETYERTKKQVSQLNDELCDTYDALEEKTERVSLLSGSLDFMQEILTAPEANNSDVKQLNSKIDEVCGFVEQLMEHYGTMTEYLPCTAGDFHYYRQSWLQRSLEWSSVARKSWLNGKTTLAFIGEFSAGKTSIVNRILSQDDPSVPQLPVSTKATTAIPTYIAGGQQVAYRFVTPDDKLKMISQQAFMEKVSKEILDQVKGVSSLIKYFVMTYKNPNLRGLSILDTPGFNSNDAEDAVRTMEVINECDALFWVFDVNAGTVNRSSIGIIKEYLNKPLYVVINKVDTKATSEVEKVEALIQKNLSDEGIAVEQFIRFSAKSPLDAILEPIKSIAHNAEKDTFFEDLAEDIQSVLSILDKRISVAQTQLSQIMKEDGEIDDSVSEHLRRLRHNCEDAKELPKWEKHFWTRDCYEMSKQQFKELEKYLESSSKSADELIMLYERKQTSLKNGIDAHNSLQSNNHAWQRTEELRLQFEKIRKKF